MRLSGLSSQQSYPERVRQIHHVDPEKRTWLVCPTNHFTLPALIITAVVPWGRTINLFGRDIHLYLANPNIGVLYIMAVTSLSVYGITLAGWSSNNKYATLGGLRSTAQMISYEISLGLSLVGVLMISGTLSLNQIVQQQSTVWNVVWQPLGFVLYFICSIAETNRLPFDLPEAETELVAGYGTEYSSLKFALFYMAEYINIITVSAISSTVFLGGYQGPFGLFPGVHWLILKMLVIIFVFMWMRGTLPRFRYDQLMRFGWKVLLPLALINIFVTAVVIVVLGK